MTTDGQNLIPAQRDQFNTTRWSIVLRIQDSQDEERRLAWNEVIEIYWYPIYVFCRRRGANDHDAMDLTQGFFSQLIGGSGLNSVSPSKGRFRSFLLASFKNYMINQHEKDAAIRRGGKHVTISLENADPDARYLLESTREESPERAFDRKWVEALITRAHAKLAEVYQERNQTELYLLLSPFLTDLTDALMTSEIGRKLNLNPATVRKSIHRMRRRFGELILAEISATVDNPDEVEEELQNLIDIVGRSR